MRFGMGFFLGNYTDWDRFEAIERGEPVGEIAVSDEQVLREQFALADLVEPLGFDTLWSFEQHAMPYLMMPDPHQFLSYFAARTSRIDVGSMIVVLPWHNPVRLAENISYLQHHLGPNRQYFMGIGRGLARRNFDSMHADMATSRERFNEVYEILKLALTQELFSYEGQFFKYENVALRPRPLDSSVITDAWGAWTTERSLREMAQRGLQPLTTPNKTLESYIDDLKLFNEIREEHGHGPAQGPILQVPMYCAESEQKAREGVERWFYEYVDSVNRAYEVGTSNFGGGKGYEDYKQGSDFGSGTREDAIQTLTSKFMRDGVWGTPEQCAERVAAHREMLGISELVCITSFGTMTASQSEHSMRLFAEHVIPKFADLRASSA